MQQQANHDEEQLKYDRQVAEYNRQKQKASSLKLMQIGLGMMSGNSDTPSYGPPPVAPRALSPYSIIRMPDGRRHNLPYFWRVH